MPTTAEDRLAQLLKQHAITLPTPLFSRVLSYISLLPVHFDFKKKIINIFVIA